MKKFNELRNIQEVAVPKSPEDKKFVQKWGFKLVKYPLNEPTPSPFKSTKGKNDSKAGKPGDEYTPEEAPKEIKEEHIEKYHNSLKEENLQELSGRTLRDYSRKAAFDMAITGIKEVHNDKQWDKDRARKVVKKLQNRAVGISKAANKLNKKAEG